MSTSHEIVPSSEKMSQTAQEGLGVGGQVIKKSEMPGIGHSGETRQPGEEDLRPGQDVRLSTTPEVVQYPVETSQPVVSGSTSEMSDLKSEKMGGVQSKGQSSHAATRNLNWLDEILIAATKLQSVSEMKSVEVELFEASKDSEWFDAIEKKNCKLLLQHFRYDRSLWVQTGLKGRSVLHVAVMQGCSELVRELDHDLVPCGKNWQTPFKFLWENARDGRLKNASAQDIWLVMEGPSDKAGDQSWEQTDLLAGRSGDDYVQSHVMCRMPVDSEDPEMLSLRDAISRIASEKEFVMDENDVDFNFENADRKELYVHMACNMLRNVGDVEVGESSAHGQILKFIIAVIIDLREKNLLLKLFDQKDAQGRTILQILVSSGNRRIFESILKILPAATVNTLDKAGRTILHWAVGHGIHWAMDVLWASGKVNHDVTFQTQYYWDITPLNLLLLYSNEKSWRSDEDFFIQYNQLNGQLRRRGPIYLPTQLITGRREELTLDILAFATLMGKKKFVEIIMKSQEYKEYKLENQLLSYAAYVGDVATVHQILQNIDADKRNIFHYPFKAPPLHLAVDATTIEFRWRDLRNFNDYLHCNDFISIELLERKLQEKDPEEDSASANTNKTENVVCSINSEQYSAKQACANLLVQAGVDILAIDIDGKMANPGKGASIEAITWWYDLVAKQTLIIQNNLNAAGTATGVVAAVVATASFVGPLTPPLNYVAMSSGTVTIDVGVQVTNLLIRVFLVSNSLSFYLAITSIMLAILPSLPNPKQGLVFGPSKDLKRSRDIIGIATGMLLYSIISVVISFAASSFLVVPLQHRGLMVYSTIIGGLICFTGIILFYLYVVRLMFSQFQNTFLRKLLLVTNDW